MLLTLLKIKFFILLKINLFIDNHQVGICLAFGNKQWRWEFSQYMSRSIIPWFSVYTHTHTHTISPGRKNKRTTQDNFSPTHVSIKSVQLSHHEGILDTWGMSMLPPIQHWMLMSLPSSHVEALTPQCDSVRRWSRGQIVRFRWVPEDGALTNYAGIRVLIKTEDTLSVEAFCKPRGRRPSPRTISVPDPDLGLCSLQNFEITWSCKKGLWASKMVPSLGGLEPPTFRLTAERANRLRHRDTGT